YQYCSQSGDFYPFMDAYADDRMGYDDKGTPIVDQIDNYATRTEVDNTRHQFQLTLGYRF
ncbi:MAG: hemin receptor, partial [Candidatus Cryptobacteroides sp.]|nr:hemin receptor [Candidatus Cryptobacteroides sp.]